MTTPNKLDGKMQRKLKYLSISTRVSILIGIIILIAMGALSTLSLMKQKEDAINSICNNTGQLSRTIEKILRVSMLKNQRDEISLAVNNIVDKENIKSIRIINHKGEIKFSSVKSEIDKNISQNDELCFSCHSQVHSLSRSSISGIKNFNQYRIDNKKLLIYNALPIYNAHECYTEACHSVNNSSKDSGKLSILNSGEKEQGTSGSAISINPNHPGTSGAAYFFAHDSSQTILGFIEIEVPIKKVVSGIENTRMRLILLTILFALVASLIVYFSIQYLIGKPVNNLVGGTIRVAQGDFKHAIPPGRAELGILSESFNKMQKQLVLTQSQLVESEKLASIGKLADEVANEIKNPLTGILIFTESLLSEMQTGFKNDDQNISSCKKDLELIRQQALKIRESIKNILSLTKRKPPVFSTTDLSKIILKAVSVVEKFSNFRNIKIINTVQKPLSDVRADSGLMEQVFLNLLLLSSDSMPSGGIINISAGISNNFLRIIFSGTGSGNRSDILKKLNVSSLSADLSESEKEGISIAVCRNIIQMHKGKLEINSEGISISITIELPVDA